MNLLASVVIGALFGVGLYQLLRRNIVRSAIGLVIVSNAINLFLLSAGAYNGLVVPYTTVEGQRPDALPQALVLTAIVIAMGGFTFVLALLYVLVARRNSVDMARLNALQH